MLSVTCVNYQLQRRFYESRNLYCSSSEMLINTQLKNTANNFSKSNILTKRSVLPPVEWDKNGLLYTMRHHMRSKITSYSYARTIMNTTGRCSTHQAYIYIYIYINTLNFEKFTVRLRVRKENKAKPLDGSAFTIVFLRAEHSRATVIHRQLWTWNKKFLFLGRCLISNPKLLASAILSWTLPDSQLHLRA